jgi:hypothetical protein
MTQSNDAIYDAVDDAIYDTIDDVADDAIHDAIDDVADDAIHDAIDDVADDAIHDAIDNVIDNANSIVDRRRLPSPNVASWAINVPRRWRCRSASSSIVQSALNSHIAMFAGLNIWLENKRIVKWYM